LISPISISYIKVIERANKIQGGENKLLFLIPIYNAIYAERINIHQVCVLTAIKLFAKIVKYEYYVKVY